MPKIFISYRRDDSAAEAGRIYSELVKIFPKKDVVKDVDTFPLGGDFRKAITEGVANSDIMLVLIGKNWLTITNASGQRRLDDPDDYVRYEINLGLNLSKVVIPVIVDNAQVPSATQLPASIQGLAVNGAAFVRNDPDFERDMQRLIRKIQEFDRKPSLLMISVFFFLIAALIIGAFIYLPQILNGNITPTEVIESPTLTEEVIEIATEEATEAPSPTATEAVEPTLSATQCYGELRVGSAAIFYDAELAAIREVEPDDRMIFTGQTSDEAYYQVFIPETGEAYYVQSIYVRETEPEDCDNLNRQLNPPVAPTPDS